MKKFIKILDTLEDNQDTTMLGKMQKKHDAFKILIATMLSARTRDEQSEPAAERLFAVYDTPMKIANAPLPKLEVLVKSTGFYKEKAKRIRMASQQILDRHYGEVPDNMTDLVALEGVGRKTAGCVMVYAFGKHAIPVDTHVHRISNRLGVVSTKTPEQTEMALEKITPKNWWLRVNELLVRHGKTICFPRNPNCPACPVKKYCDYYGDVYKPAHK
ncbi:MAG: endonuclease III [DPANN group archaeon]|nr:endonuclease III [DPANN group archaeon]